MDKSTHIYIDELNVNKKEGRCEKCNQTVFPGEGYLYKMTSWKVVHKECILKYLEKRKGNSK